MVWVCNDCGATVDEPYAPERCPRCGGNNWR